MPYEIEHNSGLWKAEFDDRRCGGPVSISIGGRKLLSSMESRLRGVSDASWIAASRRLYHKSGLSIMETVAPSENDPAPAQQTSRFAANSARITWDLKWPKETRLETPAVLGMATLEGRWTRLLSVPRSGEAAWTGLEPGRDIAWGREEAPLSVVLERDDGARFEFSFGFDLWRWDYGLGLENSAPLELHVSEDKAVITPRICDACGEGVFPEGRPFRFMATIAWSSPDMPAPQPHGEPLDIPFAEKGGLALPADIRGADCFRVDYSQMPLADAALLSMDGEPGGMCLESRLAITAFKRTIRQLAAASDKGRLILDGLEPRLCDNGSHCEKKGRRLHWDHQSIVTVVAWAKNCLGKGWSLEVPQAGIWAELPSLGYLHLPNGFDYH